MRSGLAPAPAPDSDSVSVRVVQDDNTTKNAVLAVYNDAAQDWALSQAEFLTYTDFDPAEASSEPRLEAAALMEWASLQNPETVSTAGTVSLLETSCTIELPRSMYDLHMISFGCLASVIELWFLNI